MNVNKYILPLLLCLAPSTILQTPGVAAPSTSLPKEVRALLPRGATSFLCQRVSAGPQGTKMLVHIWGSTRPALPYGYWEFQNSPFCIDVFAPVQDEKKRWGWNLVNSASYMATDSPSTIRTHWLQPAKKQGPVLEVIFSSGAPGVSTSHAVFVFDRGFEQTYTSPTPQIFGSGGSGGGGISQNFDRVDERGYMTITSENSFGGKLQSTTVYHWDGERFVAPKKAE